jgi:outer membrane assembly lipoprotein YfiO
VYIPFLSGCFSHSPDGAAGEPEAKELKGKDELNAAEGSETEVLTTAKKLYQSGMYTISRDSLHSLRERYPLGAYAQFAKLKLADSYFYNREYIQAAKHYEEFMQDFPASPDLPYVKLQAARSNTASTQGTGRDRQPLEKALVLYDELVEKYPTTEFSRIAEAERTPVIKQLSDYDQMIIDFYTQRENSAAVAARQKIFDERWGKRLRKVPYEPKAEPLLFSPPAPAVIASKNSGKPPLTLGEAAAATDTAPAQTTVQSVECLSGENPYAIVQVVNLPERLAGSLAVEELTPQAGVITLRGYSFNSSQKGYDCFAVQDLQFTESGDLTIASKGPMLVTTVDNPPRILITVGTKGG